MNHQDLRVVRAHWYEAYVAGDTERLDQLEDQAFFVVSGSGIQTRASQLEGIAAAVRMGHWFPVGSRAEDQRLNLHSISEVLVSARGIGCISTPRGSNPTVLFTELWQRADQGWRALHLHYHEATAQR